MLRLLVLVVVVALVLHRYVPRRRTGWAVPLVLGTTVVVVRTAAGLLAQDRG